MRNHVLERFRKKRSRLFLSLPFLVLFFGVFVGLVSFSFGQGNPKSNTSGHNKLSLQPEADKMRRRLGKRFEDSGHEKATITGSLTIGTDRLAIRIVRSQEESGEEISIALGGGQPSLTWSEASGAISGGVAAVGDERSIIERIVLDSPDQFIQAQLRGASYHVIARSVRPKEAGDSENYTGPVWDVVRIGEPESIAQTKPLSAWRLYYINNSTGLIDKIISQEQGETVVAELGGWVNQGDELDPTQIRWSRGGLVIMELNLNNVGHGPKQ